MIQRIVFDDLDSLSIMANQNQPQKSASPGPTFHHVKQRPRTTGTPGLFGTNNNAAAENYQFKYEFIERLLRQPEKDLTNKTLQEMANLYQELLDRQLASSSLNQTAMHFNSN